MIYVLGHKNIDFDSIASSILISRIFGYTPGMIQHKDTIEPITKKYIEYLGIDMDKFVDCFNPKGYKVFLVDHNDLSQSSEDIEYDNIIGLIDHHKQRIEIKNTFFVDKECGSTTLLIYKIFKDRFAFNEEEKKLILFGIFYDTTFFKSTKWNPNDNIYLNELGFLDCDLENLQKELLIGTEFKNLSLELISQNGYKKGLIQSSYVEITNNTDYTLSLNILDYIKQKKGEEYLFFIKNIIEGTIEWFYIENNEIIIHKTEYRLCSREDIVDYIIEWKNKKEA